MSTATPNQRTHLGFTLIEVLLATAIFSIILVAINTVFFASLRLRQRVTAAVDDGQPMIQALSILRNDLQNVVPPGGILTGHFRSEAPASTVRTTGTGASATTAASTSPNAAALNSGTASMGGLDFFTSTGLMNDDEPWADVQEVNYQLLEPANKATALGKDLVRSVNRNLLGYGTQPPQTQRLASNIESLEITFYDGVQWRDNWDTSTTDTSLPIAVRVRIQPAVERQYATVRREPIELLLPLTQYATNQVASTESTQ